MKFQTIVPPTRCPSCGSKLGLVKDQLFCSNPDCEATSSKKVEHFAKTLKIKGLGPKTIEKLSLSSPTEIYSISQAEIISILGEKMGEKLSSQIELSKKSDLILLIPAFSIPLIGNTASKKLVKVISDIHDITPNKCMEAGLGPKACANLNNWLETEFYGDLEYLPFDFKAEVVDVIQDIGKTVCITGKLNDFKNRSLAGEYLESFGFKVASSVTKKTDYLVDEEDKQSSKRTKAESLGISMITIKQIFKKENING